MRREKYCDKNNAIYIFTAAFRNSSVGGEIENFAVLHSTIVWPKPWAFNFSENLKGLYLQKVKVKEANRKGLIKSLFSFTHTVHRLELFECDLGNVNYALVRGDFVFANISRNKWTVSQGRSLDISGFSVNMKDNIIRLAETGSGDIEMRVREKGSLTLQNNTLQHSGEEARTMFEVMDIKFSGAINSVKISRSNLGRIKSNFMSGIELEKNLEISDSTMKLDGENVLNITASKFIFTRNHVEALITEALSVTVRDEASITNNIFDHLQSQSITNIKPKTQMSKLEFINNSFQAFERGFLEVHPDWDNSEMLALDKINLRVPCDCNLIQIASSRETRTQTENKLIKSSFCNGDTNSGNFILHFIIFIFQRKFET